MFHYALVLLGAVVGFQLVIRILTRRGLSPAKARAYAAAVLVGGISAALLVPYLLELGALNGSGSRSWLSASLGYSSAWGIVGASLVAWFLAQRMADESTGIWDFLGALAFAFPFAWIPVRISCALLQHHLGPPVSDDYLLWLAHQGRLELGRLELIVSAVLAGSFLLVARIPAERLANHRRQVIYLASVLFSFGLIRALTERSRVDVDPLAGQVYVGEIAGIAAVAAAILVLGRSLLRTAPRP